MDGMVAVPAETRAFVGRTAERTLLRHLLRDAGAGRSAMVVVLGAPGAGKTALLDWTAGEAAGIGAEVLRASGYESSLPFAALRRLVAPLPELAEVIRAPDASMDATATSSLVRQLIEALGAHARRRPLALLLDDVQDLGDASRTVLGDVLAGFDDEGARHALQLFVMLTARDPMEPGKLAEHVARLGAARTVALEGFDDQEVLEFLASARQRARPEMVRELLEDTGGLPLLIESEVERWRRPAGRPGPAAHHRAGDARVRSISDALRLRFDQVDEDCRDVLQQAAVLGEPWSAEELALTSERPEADIATIIAAAENARLVTRTRQGIRFAHPLVRSDLLDRLTAQRRRALHVSVAKRLRAHYGGQGALDDEVTVRVADHLLRGGPDVPRQDIADTAWRAGRIAFGWTACDQAARFLAASAEASVGLHPDDELARRYLEAGRAAYYDYDGDLAERLLAQAISAATRGGDDTVRLIASMLLARMRGGQRLRPWDRIDLAELQAALDGDLEVEVAVRLEAQAALAEGLIGRGDFEQALPVVESARRAATTVTADRSIEDALGRVDFAEGLHPMTLLELDAADALFASGLTHAVAAGNVLNEILARSRRALLGLMRGTIRTSRRELVAVEQRASAEGFWGEAGLAAALMAFADVLTGRSDAIQRVEHAYRQWRRTGNPWNAAILSAVVPALASRTAARDRHSRDPSPLWSGRSDLPSPTVMAALSAVEAYDEAAVRGILDRARWQHGFRGPVTINNTAIPVALVEVGDLIGDSAMVRAGIPPLEHMNDCGVLVTLPWPATVPRLLAVGARHRGQLDRARRHAGEARSLAEREGLAPERAKSLLEMARIAGVGENPDASEAESALAAAVRGFDEQLMPGWVARCDDVGREMRLPMAVGSYSVTRERTVFTNDIVGSTASNARLGDVLYLEQLRVHDRLLRARLKEFRGVEIKHTGDGLNAVFDDPADAVRCALAVVTDFREWNADEPELALQIRCGLAHGRLVPSGGDFFGLVQSEAARLCGLARAGEVLASAPVVEGCRSGLSAESLGRRALRGMPSETEVFRLTTA